MARLKCGPAHLHCVVDVEFQPNPNLISSPTNQMSHHSIIWLVEIGVRVKVCYLRLSIFTIIRLHSVNRPVGNRTYGHDLNNEFFPVIGSSLYLRDVIYECSLLSYLKPLESCDPWGRVGFGMRLKRDRLNLETWLGILGDERVSHRVGRKFVSIDRVFALPSFHHCPYELK